MPRKPQAKILLRQRSENARKRVTDDQDHREVDQRRSGVERQRPHLLLRDHRHLVHEIGHRDQRNDGRRLEQRYELIDRFGKHAPHDLRQDDCATE